jgi:hypothetical protein
VTVAAPLAGGDQDSSTARCPSRGTAPTSTGALGTVDAGGVPPQASTATV